MKPHSVEVGREAVYANPDLCRYCQACLLACSLYHEGRCQLELARLRVRKNMARYSFEIRVCQHCDMPDCLEACSAGAMSRDERGVVLIDDEQCTRCGSCAAACPYEAISYCEDEDLYLKCDLCMGREEGPLCVALCPAGALTLAGRQDGKARLR